jgi:hypothetical protein
MQNPPKEKEGHVKIEKKKNMVEHLVQQVAAPKADEL